MENKSPVREGSQLLGSNNVSLRERSHGTINYGADVSPDLGQRTVQDPNIQRTSYHRVKTTLKCCGFMKEYRDRLWFQIMTFCLVLTFDCADMFSDWSLFIDVVHVENGLVFGPPEIKVVYALLFFSVIGTATFSVEIVNVWLEIFHHQPLVDPEMLTVLTIWIEDIPQMAINIFIALCREDAISYYQITKAGIIILGSLIRILMGFLRFADRQGNDGLEKEIEKTGFRHLTYRVLILLGLFGLFFSSIIVCLLILFERTPDGTIQFDKPKELFYGEYDRQKFFDNVSIYLNLPILEYDNQIDYSTLNWLKLTSIDDIKRKNGDTFKLTYDNATYTKFSLWQATNNNRSILKSKECFYIARENKTLLKGPDDCTNFLENELTYSWIIRFIMIPEKIPELIFGDINFNTRFKDQNDCRNLTLQPVDDFNERVDKKNHSHPIIHYFRAKPNVSDTNHLVWKSSPNPRFYNQDSDLTDITSVWKTGFLFCKSTGSLAPHRNTSIHVPCH